MKINSYK